MTFFYYYFRQLSLKQGETMQQLTSYYPVLMVKNVEEVKNFFVKNFGFEIAYDSDWYVHLSMKNQRNINLAFVKFDHESIPEKSRKTSQGILLNLEVNDARKEYDRLKDDVKVDLDLRKEAWGQEHFIVSAPEGILVDVIKMIPPTDEFKDSYI